MPASVYWPNFAACPRPARQLIGLCRGENVLGVEGALDGPHEFQFPRKKAHFVGNPDLGYAMTFRTRAAARAYIKARYGYIATREDLKREPHGWKLSVAVRVIS